ncbi:hypothetical protein MUK42_01517 [Musa troglodytarum]|uniref:Uncharacterized protein n=1 Tax=Musa troglodytarum TaxID=320322 RepID=A0A9E7E9W3_9LILI|nr:hypothetical protein MUK42_01517 [Musa troglodytarum]
MKKFSFVVVVGFSYKMESDNGVEPEIVKGTLEKDSVDDGLGWFYSTCKKKHYFWVELQHEEFFMKLEEKNHAKKAEKTNLQANSDVTSENQEAEMRKMRKGSS